MKTTIKHFILLFGVAVTYTINAQVGGEVNAKKQDFIEMSKRTLLVELLEEDDLENVKSFAPNYNTAIQILIKKYWTYNEKIEYKTTEEIKKIKKSSNKEYVVFSFIRQQEPAIYGQSKVTSNLNVPAFVYSRIEGSERNPDYRICLPSSGIRSNIRYLEYELKFALTQMQAHFKWIEQTDKTLPFGEYAELLAKDNCLKLKDKKLQVEKGFLEPKALLKKKPIEADAVHAYGHPIEFVTSDVLNSNYTKNTAGTAILLIVPYGARQPNPMEGSPGMQRIIVLTCYKIIVDCETNEILWAEIPRALGNGNTLPFFKESEFKKMGQCK